MVMFINVTTVNVFYFIFSHFALDHLNLSIVTSDTPVHLQQSIQILEKLANFFWLFMEIIFLLYVPLFFTLPCMDSPLQKLNICVIEPFNSPEWPRKNFSLQ